MEIVGAIHAAIWSTVAARVISCPLTGADPYRPVDAKVAREIVGKLQPFDGPMHPLTMKAVSKLYVVR